MCSIWRSSGRSHVIKAVSCTVAIVMTSLELQEEEREVLISIYESDECFKEVNSTTYTYRVGETGDPKSFLVQVTWGECYPSQLPDVTLDSFYNNHLNQESKEAILAALMQEADGLLDSPMTYSLFEFAKESGGDLIVADQTLSGSSEPSKASARPEKVKKEKKEILSKAAKRKMADRINAQGELPRGWNWVDIIKLSKTGGQSVF